MQTTYDLTAGRTKRTLGLYLEPASISLGVREAGIQLKADRSWLSSSGARFELTHAAARRLIEKFGSKVTYYGKPIA